MKNKMLIVAAVAALLAVTVAPVCAAMSSANYQITTTVVSGGGGPMASASYGLNGTLGQPSPLIDPADPPWSTSYDLLTGFWYTVGPTAGCPADLDFDGDVDGSDLEILANDPGLMAVADFAFDFGRVDCMP